MDPPKCTQKSLVYENLCIMCNPGATGKKELEQVRNDVPTIYVGETSRSIYERSKEHWEGAKKGAPNNHMVKHQLLEHKGEPPHFSMRVTGSYKTALARQVGEAVRIRRRGGEGAILNSRGEFNRSYIPRLRVEEGEPEGAEEARRKGKEQTSKLLKEQDKEWERRRAEDLGAAALLGPTFSPTKRSQEDQGAAEGAPQKRRRRLEHEILGADGGSSKRALS